MSTPAQALGAPRRRLAAVGPERRDPGLDTFELLRGWRDFLDASGRSVRTRQSYMYLFTRFLIEVLKPAWEITEADVVGFLAACPVHSATRGMTLRALRSFYGWATKRGYVPHNPADDLKAKPPRPGPAPTLSDEDLTRLVVAAAWREPRRAWVILLMYATGARIGSLVHVERKDIHDDTIAFRVAKFDHTYAVPLGHVGRAAAAALLEWDSSGRRVGRWPSAGKNLIGAGPERVRQWLRSASADARIEPPVHPHLLRHCYATNLARKTDPRTWQELMGHYDLSQYARYSAVATERLREAVEDL